RNEAAAATVIADHMRQVQTGDSVARHRPGCRHVPVAAVDKPGAGSAVQARGLGLRWLDGWGHVADDLAGPVALVVADPQDVAVLGPRPRFVDLERSVSPPVHAHRRGEALHRRAPDTAPLPVGG